MMRKIDSRRIQQGLRQAGGLLLALALLLAAWPALPSGAAPTNKPPYAAKELIFVSDGMRPDLAEKYARAGAMPSYAKVFNNGVTGDNGMISQFPPNTGAGWNSISTGTWAGTHGGVNNTFHIISNAIVTSTSAFNATLNQAETYGEVAEKAGKKVTILDWPGTLPGTKVKGPVVDFRNFYSSRGVVASYEVPGVLPGFVKDFGLVYTSGLQIDDASDWTGLPTSYSPAKETSFSYVTNVISGTAATLSYPVYIYDSTNDGVTNYDKVFITRGEKNVANAQADLAVGQWKDVKTSLPQNGLLVGNYMKLLNLSADGSKISIYFTSLSRTRSNMPDLEQKIALEYPSATGADFAPLEAGIVDAQTYVEQGLKWYDMYRKVHDYVIQTYNPDVVMAGYPVTDEFSHQFMALSMPSYTGPRPVYGANPATAEGYIKQAYSQADQILGHLMELLGQNTVVLLGADHGFAPAWRSVNVLQVLQNAGLYDPANRATSKTIGYISGGTANIYINLKGREQGGVVETADYEAVRKQIRDAFTGLSDGAAKPVRVAWNKEETRNIQVEGITMSGWYASRTGDVVVVLQPPYQWDAPTTGQAIADSPFYGQHGYLPDTVDLNNNINLHAMFGVYGPGVAQGKKIKLPRVIDIAPTAAYAIGIAPPRLAEGRVLTEAFSDDSATLVPIQVLSWSDYHGQLDPVTATLDRISVPTGGVANIAAYWNEAKATNPNGTIILASGDNVGATPPNSSFLGDRPIIEAMNLMGFNATALGNHEFDKGVAGLRTLQAIAKFDQLADNIVDATTGQQADFAKPYTIVTANGIQVGIIGVGNPETPSSTSPAGTAGYRWLDPVEPTNKYVKELVGKGIKTIIVLYHQGAASGDYDNQTGKLAELAKALDPEVDLLIGGHNRVETMTRINGILTHEGNQALSTGRFTLLVDPATKNVTYSWGVFQRPYGGAITPDPALAALVKQANENIKPLLSEQAGTAAALVDRSRGAESKMGNLISDAIRATYGVDVALQNSGGLRADFKAGPLSRADVFAVLPFGNLVVTGQLKGSDLLAALENGVSDVSGSAGRFIQLSGVRFAYDASKPVGSRVVWAVLSDGKTVDPAATYKVAANDFMTVGGDGYTSLTKMINPISREQLYEVAVNYVKSLGTVDPQIEGRIVAVPAGGSAPAPPAQATPPLPTPAGSLPTAVAATAVPGTPAATSPTAVPPTATPTCAVDSLAYGLATDNALVSFNTNAPGTLLSNVPATGLQSGENLLGIDFRPTNSQLYGLGSSNRLYRIDMTSGAATTVSSTTFITPLVGTNFGFNFNPVVDRIRVVSDQGQNLRLHPDTGGVAAQDGSLTYAGSDAGAGQTPKVNAVAYTNSVAGATTTSLYDIDTTRDVLLLQNPPNNGTLNTVGALGVDAGAVLGFDIQPTCGQAFAALTVGGMSGLYRINLQTGAATLIGPLGNNLTLRGLALAPGARPVAQPTAAPPTTAPAPPTTAPAPPTTAPVPPTTAPVPPTQAPPVQPTQAPAPTPAPPAGMPITGVGDSSTLLFLFVAAFLLLLAGVALSRRKALR